MKASIITLLGAVAAVTAQTGYTTSTVRETQVITVTSCAPTVTNCPAGPHVTTIVVDLYTTVCPVTATETSPPKYPTSMPAGPASSSPAYPVGPSSSVPVAPKWSSTPAAVPTSSPAGVMSSIPAPPKTTSMSVASWSPAPVLSTITISTCIPTVITSVITVTPTPTGVVSGVASTTGGVAPAKTSTPAFISGAGSNTVASLLMAAGLFIAFL